MNLIAFLAASALLAALVWVGASLLSGSARKRRQGDGAWGWDSGDASDCGGGDGGD